MLVACCYSVLHKMTCLNDMSYFLLNMLNSHFRLELEEAQMALETTKSELSETCQELILTQTQLKTSDTQLKETEKRLSQISNNR